MGLAVDKLLQVFFAIPGNFFWHFGSLGNFIWHVNIKKKENKQTKKTNPTKKQITNTQKTLLGLN